ncbi:hypothetical protein B0I35DRAFT_277558 [Stachybotrys elegans]|uniref:F-box domain-containing protein n=1 Tax=Stachybotrys elegans TaxID=80388 RepID=A0A8K0SS33_9HYPO|nr:hypothetical protein B0I35DRAFT_277558 [Stachybotrys elegans]
MARKAATSTAPPRTSARRTGKPSALTEADINSISIASLTLDTPLIPFRLKKREKQKFEFITLPSEIRLRIYEYYFDDSEDVIDLTQENYKRYHKRLGIVRVCKQLHAEVTHYFYSTRSFRIFPTTHGRYFKTKKPLLARLRPNQLECIHTLELRLGPGFNNPPRGWVVNDALGLKQCINVHRLRIMVECDPSDGIFRGFRRSEGFYENFSCDLLVKVLEELPALKVIEFDAWPSVKKRGAMMKGLLEVVRPTKLLIEWGPERGWTDAMDEDDEKRVDLTAPFITGMELSVYSGANLAVEAEARPD